MADMVNSQYVVRCGTRTYIQDTPMPTDEVEERQPNTDTQTNADEHSVTANDEACEMISKQALDITALHDLLDSVVFKLYSTPEDIVKAYGKCAIGEIEGVVGVDEYGNKIKHSVEKVLQGIRDVGIWGFTDISSRTIHFWRGYNCDNYLFAKFLAHEYAHIAYSLYSQTSSVVDYTNTLDGDEHELNEELWCEVVSIVTGLVSCIVWRESR